MRKEQITKLYRSSTDRVLFGVCGGLGEYFNIDPVIVRILFIVLSLGGGAGVLIYFLIVLIIPEKNTSSTKKIQNSKTDIEEEVQRGNWIRSLLGIFIILFGLSFLFDQIFYPNPFRMINWNVVWAIFIMFIGANILINHKK